MSRRQGFQGPAGFPRTPRAALAEGVFPPGALPPVQAFESPKAAELPRPVDLPASGVGKDVEARTVVVPWGGIPPGSVGVSGEFQVYTTKRQWLACDVYLSDTNPIGASMVISIRIYAVSGQGGPPTLVASGRAGNFATAALAGAQPLRIPLWIAAGRANVATAYAVTFEIEQTGVASMPLASGQTSLVTVVASDRANDVPPLLGAIRLASFAAGGSALLKTARGAELLMVQAIVAEGVTAPRYLHVHERNVVTPVGKTPAYVFPLGAAISAAGGGLFGGTFWFPPGLRPLGSESPSVIGGIYQVAMSSTALVTTLAAAGDGLLQGLYR